MEKIDRRRHYVLILDTETANTHFAENGKMDMSDVLMYDCGWAVIDTKRNVYRERSFVNEDVFYDMADVMSSAYYNWKIPQYLKDIANGERIVTNTYTIRQTMLADMEEYGITEIVAHNARFDVNALNTIQRVMTNSKYRYWFPYGTIILDTMKGARDVMHKMPTYIKFCEEHGYTTKNGKPSTTAENLYRFIINDPGFTEEHKALQDVQIEREIFWYCRKQHKKMDMQIMKPKEDYPIPTEFQKKIMKIVRENA